MRKIFILTAFLILGIGLIASINVDYSQSVGLPSGNVYGQGIQTQDLGNGETRFICAEAECSMCFAGSCISNIKPKGINNLGQVDFKDGEITQADFTSNEEGGTYVFGGTEISNPPDSRLIYHDDEINLKSGNSEFTAFPKFSEAPDLENHLTIVEGSNIKLPGDFFLDGKLNFFENRIFLSLADGTSINDVLTLNKYSKLTTDLKETDVYLDGNEHDITSLSLGKSSLVLESSVKDGPVAKFNEENPYIKIEKNDNVAVQPSEGKIKVKNRDSEGKVPEIQVEGNSVIVNGDKSLIIEKGKVYLASESNKSAGSSPTEIVVKSKDGKSSMKEHKVFVDNSKKIAVVPEKESENVASSGGRDENSAAKVSYNYESKQGFLERLFKKATNLFRKDPNWEQRTAVIGSKG